MKTGVSNLLEIAEPCSLVEERLLQLPVPQSSKAVCGFSAGSHTSRLLVHSVLILFTALAGQDEGLLVGYTSLYTVWSPPAVVLRDSSLPGSCPLCPRSVTL